MTTHRISRPVRLALLVAFAASCIDATTVYTVPEPGSAGDDGGMAGDDSGTADQDGVAGDGIDDAILTPSGDAAPEAAADVQTSD